MTQMEDNNPKKKKPRKANCFLGCFGISNQENKLVPNSDYNYVKSTGGKKNKKYSLFSFKKFVRKHSPAATKTIPVDVSDRSREIHVVKSEKKTSVQTPAINVDVTQVTLNGQKNITQGKANKTKDAKTEDKIRRNNKSLDHLFDNLQQNSTCPNEFSRSVTISSTHSLNNLNSPNDDKHHDIKLSHSTSLPPSRKKKLPAATTTTTGKVNEVKSSQRHDRQVNNSVDSFIGMSILMVTLFIMLFWGKVCAIICTSAWLYFLPRFRMMNKDEVIVAGKKNGVSGNDVDVNSEEYKKKIVLEGFLERNHKNGVGFL